MAMPAHGSPAANPTAPTRAVSTVRVLNQVQLRLRLNHTVCSLAERHRVADVCDKGECDHSAKDRQLISISSFRYPRLAGDIHVVVEAGSVDFDQGSFELPSILAAGRCAWQPPSSGERTGAARPCRAAAAAIDVAMIRIPSISRREAVSLLDSNEPTTGVLAFCMLTIAISVSNLGRGLGARHDTCVTGIL